MATSVVVPTSPVSSLPRRAGAVLAGLVTVFVTSTATDAVLHATGVYPPVGAPPMSDGLFVLALGYRTLFGVLGGWVTARLAPVRPVRHAVVLGLVGVVLSTAGAVAMWDAGPAWYPLALIASAVPCAYAGGRLGARGRA